MKSSFVSIVALMIGFTAASPRNAHAAVNLVGLTVVWSENTTSAADTIGGNARWNAYVRDASGVLLNSGDGADTTLDYVLVTGSSVEFDILLNDDSWADDSVAHPGSIVNVFIDDRTNPVFSVNLSAGNVGALKPVSPAEVGLVPNAEDGTLVAPATTLSYTATSGDIVTIDSLTFAVSGNEVSAYDHKPTGLGGNDSVLSVKLTVAIPEPASGLLVLISGLALLARRSRCYFRKKTQIEEAKGYSF